MKLRVQKVWEKPHAKARRRKDCSSLDFAPLREKFHAAIFLLLSVFKLPSSGIR